MSKIGKMVITAGAVFVLAQLVRPRIPEAPAAAELQAPEAVKHVVEKNCYSCHSNERRLAWFDEVEPAYWLVRKDILTAREHLNFSTIGQKPPAAQKAALYEAVNMIQLGAMPLPRFTRLHPEARVTQDELATLKSYLSPWTAASGYPGASPVPNSNAQGSPNAAPPPLRTPLSLSSVGAELNGLTFDGDFENWKLISTTDRGDNNTFRFILGNNIAIQAARTGRISPWPAGTRFAKIAWQQELGEDGLIHPGKFVQVELMVKDAQSYKQTKGWAWGRWRGLNLQPYGNDARFVNECTSCHLPTAGNDYVYTLPITLAHGNRPEVVNNPAAELPPTLPFQPLTWSVITMFVDPKTLTTGILFGNKAAMQAVHARTSNAAPEYGAGSVAALVTWAQRDDPHWFGGRIPGAAVSVEFVEIGYTGDSGTYRKFAGPKWREVHPDGEQPAQRKAWIRGLPAAELP